MSETFRETKASVDNLKKALVEANGDTRLDFAFWVIGILMMATAIVANFGWLGFMFCTGLFIWSGANHRLSE